MQRVANQGSASVVAAFGLVLAAVCLATMIRTAHILERRAKSQELADRTAYEIAYYQALFLDAGALTNDVLVTTAGLAAGTFGFGHLAGLVLDIGGVSLPEGIELHKTTQDIIGDILQPLNELTANFQDQVLVELIPFIPLAVVAKANLAQRDHYSVLHYPTYPPFEEALETPTLSVKLPLDDRGVAPDFSLLLQRFIQPAAASGIHKGSRQKNPDTATSRVFKQDQVLDFTLPMLLHPDFGERFQIATVAFACEESRNRASLFSCIGELKPETFRQLKLSVAQARAFSPTQDQGGNWLVPDFEPRLTAVTVGRNAQADPEDLWYVWH